MKTNTISSDQARAKWRELLDTAVSGDHTIIERYGKPVAVLVPYADYVQSGVVRESTAVYQTTNQMDPTIMLQTAVTDEWAAQLQQLRQRIAKTGGIMNGFTKEEIVERLRQTRQEIFEAEYAHLYR
ncbi:MAG: type II toxin-antitoxin system prevent-host-death family antitoxin [Chloroflexi bacterium]|nr:type II toxin-antitoxin system prevent-host-death family antitoxin [Chloroflexota bacterium]